MAVQTFMVTRYYVSPRKFQNTLEELDKKGYRLKEAAVNFVVYWERRKDKQEVKIVLPKIIVEKNTD